MTRRSHSHSFLALTLAGLAACTTDTKVGPQGIASLLVSPATASLFINDTLVLQAVATDARGILFVGVSTTWTSSAPAVAAVDADGRVIAGVSGTATITARAEGLTATAQLQVTPVPAFTLSASSASFTAFRNGPTPGGKAIGIRNSGGGTLTQVRDSIVYTPASDAGWLTATVPGSAPDSLRLSVNQTSLALGSHAATVFLLARRASTVQVQVTYSVGVGVPATLTKVAGVDSQSAIAATPVPIAPAVRVQDQYANLLPNVEVQFAVTAGGGTLGQLKDTTDANGLASPGSWTLGPSAGTNQFTITTGALTPVILTAFGNPGNATTLSYVSGNTQTDTVAATLASPYTVRVTDVNGNGVGGVTIAWAVPPSTGSITPTSPQTDANGFASATRVLGTVAGTQTATASVGGLSGSPVSFTATANAGVARTIAVSQGNNQYRTVDSAVIVKPAVLVTDGFGNQKSGVAVTFAATAGNGSVTGGSQSTVNGIATVGGWTLGSARKIDTLTATASGLTGSPVIFQAHAAWSLQRHVQPQLFTPGCTGCHAGGPAPNLQNDTVSYQSLLNGNGTMTIYVTPFDTTDDGFTKTHGNLLFRLKSPTSPMPPGTPLSVSNPALYALVRDWILDGAQR